jgi:macrophage erythroblast attacher
MMIGVTPEQLQRIMVLVALRADTQLSPYKELFAESRWETLAKQFREECCRLYQLPAYPQIHAVLQAGLSALKTTQCYATSTGARRPASNCPVCTKQLGELARGLPFSHCSQSRLICFISGALMNEHNPPLMLPNGYVYSRNVCSHSSMHIHINYILYYIVMIMNSLL